jgi:hypothetical protein
MMQSQELVDNVGAGGRFSVESIDGYVSFTRIESGRANRKQYKRLLPGLRPSMAGRCQSEQDKQGN